MIDTHHLLKPNQFSSLNSPGGFLTWPCPRLSLPSAFCRVRYKHSHNDASSPPSFTGQPSPPASYQIPGLQLSMAFPCAPPSTPASSPCSPDQTPPVLRAQLLHGDLVPPCGLSPPLQNSHLPPHGCPHRAVASLSLESRGIIFLGDRGCAFLIPLGT